MINVWGSKHTNYLDLIITHCAHILKCHTIPHKYLQLLSINFCQLKLKILFLKELEKLLIFLRNQRQQDFPLWLHLYETQEAASMYGIITITSPHIINVSNSKVKI
jgi:hypothetical protein